MLTNTSTAQRDDFMSLVLCNVAMTTRYVEARLIMVPVVETQQNANREEERSKCCKWKYAITDLVSYLPQRLVDKRQGQSETCDQNMLVVSANFPNCLSSRPFLQLGEF